MKHILKVISGTAFGLACLVSTAPAALVLSGSTAGFFQDPVGGVNVINNAPDGSFASFRTGVPIFGSFMSGVEFTNETFTNVSNGDSFGFGMIQYFNGRTLIGTSSATADLDFYLDLDDPAIAPFLLTTVTFGIDATVNEEGTNPDVFTASFTQPGPVLIGDQWVNFTINSLPWSTEVRESGIVSLANVTVTMTPIPEPATYGMIASASLLGLAAYRRYRGQKGRPTGSAPLAAA